MNYSAVYFALAIFVFFVFFMLAIQWGFTKLYGVQTTRKQPIADELYFKQLPEEFLSKHLDVLASKHHSRLVRQLAHALLIARQTSSARSCACQTK